MVSWGFETAGDAEGWEPTNQLDGFTVADGAIRATSTGGDPFLSFPGPMSLDASAGATVEITMTSSTAGEGQVFWGTADQPGAAESRSVRFGVDAGEPQVYRVTVPPQTSPVTTLRFDPLSTVGESRIERIRVLR